MYDEILTKTLLESLSLRYRVEEIGRFVTTHLLKSLEICKRILLKFQPEVRSLNALVKEGALSFRC